ncbi:MAG: chemotaxis protein CheV [Candidatus Magnetomorum sp.]|nr:chemotaxis protein CheV [Candidatus Magnetomorum sp.]
MEKSLENGDILLESGTNEVEIAEFFLGSQSYGVNVAKIKEFVPYNAVSITRDLNAPRGMVGVFMLRGDLIPLIDLNVFLNLTRQDSSDRKVILVTEFNNMITGFVVDGINQIHRLTWEDLKIINPVMKQHTDRLTGSVHHQDSDILILDLEHIISEIFPVQTALKHEAFEKKIDTKPSIIEKRANKKILVVDDSSIARESIHRGLHTAGYVAIKILDNGTAAMEYIEKLTEQSKTHKQPFNNYLNLIVTDIEMPQMDGLTLCKKVRERVNVEIPIIIFSSLITEQMTLKCKSVGASGYATKPNIGQLVERMDSALNIINE